MATEIRLAHDRGHEEQMRDLLDLAGVDENDVHWYPRPGDHAHGGVVLAPDRVAQLWHERERRRLAQPGEDTPADDLGPDEGPADDLAEEQEQAEEDEAGTEETEPATGTETPEPAAEVTSEAPVAKKAARRSPPAQTGGSAQ